MAIEHLITEQGMLLLAMQLKTEIAQRARDEITAVVAAWHRGELLPKEQTPTLCKLYSPDLQVPLGDGGTSRH